MLLGTGCSNRSVDRPVGPTPSFGSAASNPARTAPNAETGGRGGDQEVSFESGGVTVYGTFRRPVIDGLVPAVLLLAGSGPTDRNGDSRLITGSVGTLAFLADRFAEAGVASFRYDKLGSGTTGLGPFADHPNDLGFDTFTAEARDALTFLATRPGVDPSKLLIGGHSEGGLIAMVVANEPGSAPVVAGLAIFNTPGIRYLDIIAGQVKRQTAAAAASGAMSATARAAFDSVLDRSIAAIRAGSPLPTDLPNELKSLFNSSTRPFSSRPTASIQTFWPRSWRRRAAC